MPQTAAQYELEIKAKPDDVFAYVSDLSKHGEWAFDPLEITPDNDDPIAVGKSYHSTAQFRGSEVAGEQRVTVYEPSSKFSFTVKDSTSEGVHEFTFASQGDGTLMTRNVTSQWSLMMWPVAKTLGH